MIVLKRADLGRAALIGALACSHDQSQAVDVAGHDSAATVAASVAPLPAPEQLLASGVGLGQARLSWKDRSASESGFEILRSTTGGGGAYSLLATVSPNVTSFTNSGLSSGRTYCYQVRAKAGGGAATSAGSNRACITAMSGGSPAVRVVTFGDSNTDWGLNGTAPRVLARSYISQGPYTTAMLPHTSDQLAGKIEARWRLVRANAVRAVNHAIAGTTTGGGSYGGPNRRQGSPQARTLVGGVTRFQGEVLGVKWPWSGGEPVSSKYADGAVRRVQAFVPGTNDFVYVSMGTNDAANRIGTSQTLANLRWMIDTWRAAGRRADHFLITTLAPRTGDASGVTFPALNDGIRALAASTGVVLIDLAAHTSADNGRTWRSASLHVGDGVHYSESVRDWLAGRIVDEMRSRVP